MKGIDPFVHGKKVITRVYNEKNNSRLVRQLRIGRSYGRCTTIDIIGCNMLCSYCWVDTSFLVGQGELLDKEIKQGRIKFYTPEELTEKYLTITNKRGWPARIQLTGAEPFLTPLWIMELLRLLKPHLSKLKETIWIDTNGLNITDNPTIMEGLKKYSDILRLFVSSKNWPRDYALTTGIEEKHSETGLKCVDLLWQNKIMSYLQAPLTPFFDPASFEWYFKKLSALHPAAPLFLDLDRMCYLPLNRVPKRLKRAGLWERRRSEKEVEAKWLEFLGEKYSRKIKRLFSVDSFPDDQYLVKKHIFGKMPLEKCCLFE